MATVEGGVSAVSVTGLTPAETTAITSVIQGALSGATQVAQTGLAGGGTLVVGTGSTVGNFSQVSSVIAPGSGVGLNNVTVSDNLVQMQVSTPAGVVINTQGTTEAVTATTAQNYFQTLIDAAIPASADTAAVRGSIATATQTAANAVGGEGAVVRVATISDTQAGVDGVVRLAVSGTGDAAGANVVQAIVTGNNTENRIVVEGAKAVAVVGSGQVELASAGLLVGDSGNQVLVGSAGADTLIGGTGNDTIIGGFGDTIGFNGLGNFNVQATATGTASGNYIMDFSALGIRSLQELASYIVGTTTNADGSVTYDFGAATITLTGISDSQLQFTWAV